MLALTIATPISGTSQNTCAWADQPYQKKPMGERMAQGIMTGTRN